MVAHAQTLAVDTIVVILRKNVYTCYQQFYKVATSLEQIQRPSSEFVT